MCVPALWVKEDQVIRLDSAVIRTNRGNPPLSSSSVLQWLLSLSSRWDWIPGLQERNANKSTPSPASSSELTERLNQPSE
ncbi:Heme oxygenase 1 [Dissostichus eleginoides]|uniref:Heme oxygenase 1 n=1 Tax=Dissostichus eleginoides TaxID=100907 RepID=A0AAD9BCY6_DISEL|nr:Heme oxygenase 1 [Dissostichus eleginoides]